MLPSCLNDGVLSVSGKRCQISVSQMTDGKDRDLVSRRTVSIEEAALVCGGRLFHARAAATGNARSPRVDRRVDGASNVGESTERIDGDERPCRRCLLPVEVKSHAPTRGVLRETDILY